MLYGYARVSTQGQARDGNSIENQTHLLTEAGVPPANVFTDAYTGTKTHRPNLDTLLSLLGPGDTLIVAKLDRLARSASGGIELVDKLLQRDVRVHILNMGVLDNTPTGKLIRNIMFSFAEFERDMIVERTQEGKQIARTRPDFKEGRPALDPIIVQEIKDHGGSPKWFCEKYGISRSTYYKYKNA